MKVIGVPKPGEMPTVAANVFSNIQRTIEKATIQPSRPVAKPEPKHFDIYLDEIMEDMVVKRNPMTGKSKLVPWAFIESLL